MPEKEEQDIRLDPFSEKLSTLFEHDKSGRFSDAENLAVRITKEFPEHPFSWKVLGLLFKQLGRPTDLSMDLKA